MNAMTPLQPTDITDSVVGTEEPTNTVVYIPFNQLMPAPENCRTERPTSVEVESVDENSSYSTDGDIDSMAQSLSTEGQLVNLIVYRHENDGETRFFVTDGETRRLGTKLRIERGEISDSHPMLCAIYSQEDAVRLSWIANMKRRDLSLCDKFLGYKRLIESGMSKKAVADLNNVPVSELSKILRLSDLHPAIFEYMKDGNMELSAACVYASVSDRDRQFDTFTTLKQSGTESIDWNIRQHLSTRHIKGSEAVALFVGEDAYKMAGGVIDVDLFSTQETAQWMNPDIAHKLAEKKLDEAAEPYRSQWNWVAIDEKGNNDFSGIVRRFTPSIDFDDLPNEVTEKRSALTTLIESLNKKLEQRERIIDEQDIYFYDDDECNELTESIETHEEELEELTDQITSQHGVFTDLEKKLGGVIVSFSRKGEIEIHTGLLHTDDSAEYKKALKDQSPHTKTDSLNSDVELTPSNSPQSSIKRDLSVAKRSVIRAVLSDSNNVTVARDLMEYSLCRRALEPYYASITFLSTSIQTVVDNPPADSQSHEIVEAQMSDTLKSLSLDWMKEDSEQLCLESFIALSRKKRDALVSYSIATSLLCGSSSEMTTMLPDSVLNRMDINTALLWRPDRNGYFKRLKSDELYSLGQLWYGKTSEFSKQHVKTKKSERLDAICRVFEADVSELSDVERLIRDSWLPEEVHV